MYQDGQTFIIMPSVSSEKSAGPAADDSQSNDGPSSSECDDKSPVAITTTSVETAEARQLQVPHDLTLPGDVVNLSDVDHVQTVITAQPSAAVYEYPGLCPICGDKISGIYLLSSLVGYNSSLLVSFLRRQTLSVYVSNVRLFLSQYIYTMSQLNEVRIKSVETYIIFSTFITIYLM